MFIVYEGVDGTGKSTQLSYSQKRLEESGHAVTVCRDPGSTSLGDRLREILLKRQELEIAPTSELFLFMAARSQLVEEVIRPALAEDRIVLCDRFLLSTVVYQGHAGGMEPETIWRIGESATGGLHPDLTLIFDTPIDVAMRRIGDRPDRMESRGEEYLARVRRGFLAESAQMKNVEVIDASGDPAEIQDQVQAALAPLVAAITG